MTTCKTGRLNQAHKGRLWWECYSESLVIVYVPTLRLKSQIFTRSIFKGTYRVKQLSCSYHYNKSLPLNLIVNELEILRRFELNLEKTQ